MIHNGDCLSVMAEMEPNSIDAIVTDPPYGLEFMGKDWDKLSTDPNIGKARAVGFDRPNGKPDSREQNKGGTWFGSRPGESPNYYRTTNAKCRKCGKWRISGGHDGLGNTLGCKCELPDFPNVKAEAARQMQEWHFAWAVAALRVAKPGCHLLAFGGTRTFHRLACAIEDAGWEIRDCLFYCYGSGFPKSHNIGCKCGTDTLQYNHASVSQETMPDMPRVLATEEPLPGQEEQDLRADLQRQEDKPDTEKTDQAPGRAKGGNCSVRCLQEADMEAGCMVEKTDPANLFSALQRNRPVQKPKKVQREHEGAEAQGQKIRGGQSSLEGRSDLLSETRKLQADQICAMPDGVPGDGAQGRICDGASPNNGDGDGEAVAQDRGCPSQEPQSAGQSVNEPGTIPEQSGTQDRRICPKCGGLIDRIGYGSALKPAFEPIIIARKPLDGTLKQNCLKWGTGAINVDGCRVPANPDDQRAQLRANTKGSGRYVQTNDTAYSLGPANADHDPTKGRWPANLIHDGSEEVLELFPSVKAGVAVRHRSGGNTFGGENAKPPMDDMAYGDSGSAARFFYCAKASRAEREMGCEGMEIRQVNKMGSFGNQENFDCPDGAHRIGDKGSARMANHHPTVKPLSLMRYLCRLVTPPDGIVLDPFMGSGTTGMAAKAEGFRFVGIEKEPEYVEIAERRIGAI